MYFALVALLGLSTVISTSPLHEFAAGSAQTLHKRDWILECALDVPIPVEVNQFASLNDLCSGYPHGLGLFCDAAGHRDQRTPTSLISRTYGNHLIHVCLNYCACVDLAPDPPTVREALNAQFEQCAISSDERQNSSSARDGEISPGTTCSSSETGSQAYVDACNCDEFWYGKPENQDCQLAMLRLPDHGTTRQKVREFVAIGARARQIGVEDPPARTPIISTHGSCTVAVLLPEGPGMSDSIVVDTLEMNSAAEDLREKCVQGERVGGKFHQSSSWRSDEIHELPEIVMFAPSSKWKQFLDMKYTCAVSADGDAQCKPVPVPKPRTKSGAYGIWKYMGSIGSQGWTPVPKGSKQKCSGSCYDPTDCDINSDCLCASEKGIPLSSSWGQHSCMYVAGAAAAIAAAAVSPNACRGRCLLQDDGTLDIGRPQNGSNATGFSFDATNDLANLTGPFTASLDAGSVASPSGPYGTVFTGGVLGNTSDLDPVNVTNPNPVVNTSVTESEATVATSSSDPNAVQVNQTTPPTNSSASEMDNGAFPSGPDYSAASADNSTAPSSNDSPIPEINGVPTVSSDTDGLPYGNASTPPPEYVIFNDTSPDQSAALNCPCNCTYVSAACCLSEIVYEDPSMQIPMRPLPANTSICCDPISGKWLPKSSGECSSAVLNGTAAGFIGLGNVKWNSSGSAPLGFPDPDDNNT